MNTQPSTEISTEIRPFTVEVPQAQLDDLQARLANTRFAPAAPGDSWDYGTPESYLRDMVGRWQQFDWRAEEARINAHPNFVTDIDGQTVHFVHVRSEVGDATPLLLAHTYPGSFTEFLEMIAPLTDPVAHGGTEADAFHVVIPSMPGFGFSTPVAEGPWTMARIARTYDALMRRLGYDSYGIHGSDGGALVSRELAVLDPRASAARTCSSSSRSRPARRARWTTSARGSTPRSRTCSGSRASAATTP